MALLPSVFESFLWEARSPQTDTLTSISTWTIYIPIYRYDQYQDIYNFGPRTKMPAYVAQMSVLCHMHYIDLLRNEHLNLMILATISSNLG